MDGHQSVYEQLRQWREELVQERLRIYTKDLVAWINNVLKLNIDVENAIDELGTGVGLLDLALAIQAGETDWYQLNDMAIDFPIAKFRVKRQAAPGSFGARDNVAQFIAWARRLGIPDDLMFETNDLVLKQNVKHFIYCLMEIARCQHGVPPPMLVSLERSLEDLDEDNSGATDEETQGEVDQAVRDLLHSQNLDETLADNRDDLGRYYFGQNVPVFVRALNDDLLVPLDDDWMTLRHYFRLIAGNYEDEIKRLLQRCKKVGKHVVPQSQDADTAGKSESTWSSIAARLQDQQRAHEERVAGLSSELEGEQEQNKRLLQMINETQQTQSKQAQQFNNAKDEIRGLRKRIAKERFGKVANKVVADVRRRTSMFMVVKAAALASQQLARATKALDGDGSTSGLELVTATTAKDTAPQQSSSYPASSLREAPEEDHDDDEEHNAPVETITTDQSRVYQPDLTADTLQRRQDVPKEFVLEGPVVQVSGLPSKDDLVSHGAVTPSPAQFRSSTLSSSDDLVQGSSDANDVDTQSSPTQPATSASTYVPHHRQPLQRQSGHFLGHEEALDSYTASIQDAGPPEGLSPRGSSQHIPTLMRDAQRRSPPETSPRRASATSQDGSRRPSTVPTLKVSDSSFDDVVEAGGRRRSTQSDLRRSQGYLETIDETRVHRSSLEWASTSGRSTSARTSQDFAFRADDQRSGLGQPYIPRDVSSPQQHPRRSSDLNQDFDGTQDLTYHSVSSTYSQDHLAHDLWKSAQVSSSHSRRLSAQSINSIGSAYNKDVIITRDGQKFRLVGVREIQTTETIRRFASGREPEVLSKTSTSRQLTPAEIEEKCLLQKAQQLYADVDAADVGQEGLTYRLSPRLASRRGSYSLAS
eukprot:m.119389 g.119389  ORF g.119389 m.119389 type:complete len:872 (-) comp15469_c0_seq2:149-2764(-)